MKYRIKKHNYIAELAPSFFTAEYKCLGIWMKIKADLVGSFDTCNKGVYCESIQEARERVTHHKTIRMRVKHWQSKCAHIVENL